MLVAGLDEEAVQLDVCKCTGPDQLPVQMLRDLSDVFVRPFQRTLDGHDGWECFLKNGRGSSHSCVQEMQKDAVRNCRQVDLTLVTGEEVREILPESSGFTKPAQLLLH